MSTITLAQGIALVRSGDFAIIADEPIIRSGKPYTLAQYLNDAWYHPIASIGCWQGETELGFVVPHMGVRAAILAGETFGQTCVVAGNAVWYTNGPDRGEMIPLDCASATFASIAWLNQDYTRLDTCDGSPLYFHLPEPIVNRDSTAAYVRDSAAIYHDRYRKLGNAVWQ